jgi:hypothetical protein
VALASVLRAEPRDQLEPCRPSAYDNDLSFFHLDLKPNALQSTPSKGVPLSGFIELSPRRRRSAASGPYVSAK